MQWDNTNELTLEELVPKLKVGKLTCANIECERTATDKHHLDGNHSNNDPSNLAPACKPCHDEEHGISADLNDLKQLVREFYDVQDHRKALTNRIGAYDRLGLKLNYSVKGLEQITTLETTLRGYIIAMLKAEPFYNVWLKKVKGIGPLLAASLIAEIGSPTRYQTVSQLWAYSGMDVRDGQAPKRRRGEPANWNGRLRMTLYKVASSFIKNTNCFGRKLYDEYKTYYIERDGPEPKWRPHRRAMRHVEKDFIRCLWRAWMIFLGHDLYPCRPETTVFEDDWVET